MFHESLENLKNDSFIDLGSDHWLQPDYVADELWGFIIYHPHAETGELCAGYINVKPGAVGRDGEPRPVWKILELSPLTLSPSIHAVKIDGDHGWIQNGKWVKA
jgi:hypothetical protein